MRIKLSIGLVVVFSFLVSAQVDARALQQDPFVIGDPFSDIEGSKARSYIEDLRLRGIVSGKESGIFAPEDNISRAELTKIALEAFSPRIREDLRDKQSFLDVTASEWFSHYVNQAEEESVVEGYEDGTFRPNQNINRVEALKILLEASGVDLSTTEEAPFIDVDLSEWYGPYVHYSFENVIDWGTITEEGFEFRPGDPATREEIARMASIILRIKEKEQLIYNSSFSLLNEEQSQSLNAEHGLASSNLWWIYINEDYGFSLNLPTYIAFNGAESGQFYPTTFFEDEEALFLTSDNNEENPLQTRIDFGSADTEDELISIIEDREPNCTIIVNSSEDVDDEVKKIFFESKTGNDIGQSLICGNLEGFYNVESKTFVYYERLESSIEHYYKGVEDDVYIHNMTPFDLILFRYKNNFDNLYRQNYPDNELGNLPKPAKMYFDDENNIFALSRDGDKISLNLSHKIFEDIEYDRYEHGSILFDKSSNRIFFIEDGVIKYYDIGTDAIVTTPITISLGSGTDESPFTMEDSDGKEIVGAYGDHIVLRNKGGYAAEGLFKTLNIHTGVEVDINALTVQREYQQTHLLFLGEKAYEITLESETSNSFPVLKNGGLYTRTVSSSGRYLGIYLEETENNYDELVEQMKTEDPLMLLLKGLTEEMEKIENNSPTPLLEVETNLPEHIGSNSYELTFKVRNLFMLDDNRVAIEVDNSLVVIDLDAFTAELVTNIESISALLDSAVLLVPAIENNFDFAHEPYCNNFIEFNEESISESDVYISCLE